MKNFRKIVLVALALIAALLLIAGLLAQRYVPPMLIEQLQHTVEEKTKGRYTLRLESLRFSPWTLSVHLGDLRFDRNANVTEWSGIPVLDEYDLHIDFNSLDVNYFHLLRFIRRNDLDITRIRLANPLVVMRRNPDYTPPETGAGVDSTVAEVPADTSRKIAPTYAIEELDVEDLNFFFYEGPEKAPTYKLRGLTTRLYGLHSEKKALFEVKDMLIELDTAYAAVAGNTARLDLTGFHLSDLEGFRIDSMHYGHTVSPKELNRIKAFRASWMDIQVADFRLEGLDYERLIHNEGIALEKITIDRFFLDFFKDKEEATINPRRQPLPPELVRSIPIPVAVDTLKILHADLVVKMQQNKAFHHGTLTIDDVQALVTNLTNMTERLEEDPLLKLNVRGKLMDRAPVELAFRFNIPSPRDAYSGSARVGEMDLALLNDFVGSQFFVEFREGRVKGMSFDYEADRVRNEGYMDLEYNDLKVGRLTNYEDYIRGKPKTGLIAGLGNLIVANNRSKEQNNYRQGIMYYEKEYNRDFIHGMIQTMLSGFVSSLGFGPKTMEKAEAKAERKHEKEKRKAE